MVLFFLACGFVFLWFWPESLCFVWGIFLGFFSLLLLLLLFCYIVLLEESVYFLFIYFFESRLIPTLFLILGWGYQPGRVQAGVYLLFYTLLASLPLLVGILFIYNSLVSLCLFLLSGIGYLVGNLFYICMVFAFLVKMPMFMVHL
jgi:NADH-ubiquinone oxidoreductase chain 4